MAAFEEGENEHKALLFKKKKKEKETLSDIIQTM